jgi:hypothetical protein
MFYIIDPLFANIVFLEIDPRTEGYQGEVVHVAKLDVPDDLRNSRESAEYPLPVVGMSKTEPMSFRVFRTEQECRDEPGYVALGGNPIIRYASWKDYRQVFPERPA